MVCYPWQVHGSARSVVGSGVAARGLRDRWGGLRRALRLLCAALLPAFVGAGCAQTRSNLPPAPMLSTPVAGEVESLPPYRLQVGDVLDIKLLLNPDLNEEVTVRPDGKISTTIAEDVAAYDRTPQQLAAALRAAYATELQSPRVAVIVRSFAPTRVYVAGEVVSPGEFITIGPDLTLVQAVARAGGVRLSGDTSRVFLLRRGPQDRPEVYSVDYQGAIRGDPRADIRLAPYDIVYVPRTGIFQAYADFNQYIQQFLPVSWGFSYNVNPVVTNTSR